MIYPLLKVGDVIGIAATGTEPSNSIRTPFTGLVRQVVLIKKASP